MNKALVFSALLVLLIAAGAEAKMGIAISPSGGAVYSFPADGGTVQFTVFNAGDESTVFSLALSGDGAEFAKLPTAQISIAPGGYESIDIAVGAEAPAVVGTNYPLVISVHGTSAITGATADVSSQVALSFSSQKGTKTYSADVSKAAALDANREVRPFYILGLLVILLAAFYLVKSKDVV